MKRLLFFKTILLFFLLTVAQKPSFSAQELIEEYSFRMLNKASAPQECKVVRITTASGQRQEVVQGILFTYNSRKSKYVSIAGDFNNWEKTPMTRGKNGVWYFFLSEYDAHNIIRYKFNVDGLWISDPENKRVLDDRSGSYVSLAAPIHSPESKQVSYRIIHENGIPYVEFRTYNPQAYYISVVGDFNNWNPENDRLKKDASGIWRIKLNIPAGTYRYKFLVDGKWALDVYNEKTASDGLGGISSLLTLEP